MSSRQAVPPPPASADDVLLRDAGPLHALVEQSLLGIGMIRDRRFIFVNPRLAEIFGYTEEELLALDDVLAVVDEDDRERVAAALERRLAGEGSRVQSRIGGVRRDGERIRLEVHGLRTESRDGPAVIATVLDITEQAAAEESLRRSEERLRLVVRAANEVIWEWDVRSGALLWSEDAPAAFRCEPGELLPTVEWWYEHLHPDDREEVVSGLHQVANGTGKTWSAEYRFRRGDGTFAVILDRGFVVRDTRGQAVRMIGSMLDITERRRTEDTQRFLARASALLNTSLEYGETLPALARLAVPAVGDYCLVDVIDGDVARRVAGAHATPAKEALLGIGTERRLGDPADDPVAAVVRTRAPLMIPGSTESALGAVDPDPARRPELARLEPGSTMVVPLLGHEGPLGALVLATDGSGRRYDPLDLLLAEDLARRIALALENASLYARAQSASRARERILGVVSHDLRNPLSTIQMSTSLIAAKTGDGDEGVQRPLSMIERAVESMNQMIADLLDLSTIDAGGFALVPAETDVSALIGEVGESFAVLAEEAGVTLECGVGERVASVWVDSRQVLRVLSNLVGNALKFTPAGGRIAVRAERVEEGVCFTVADTGPGIPPDQLAHVFDRYWQAHRGDRRGSGLGLAIARGIVEAHGGSIRAESTPGNGATFLFTVPVRPDG